MFFHVLSIHFRHFLAELSDLACLVDDETTQGQSTLRVFKSVQRTIFKPIVSVTIYYSTDEASWNTLTTVTTDSEGSYSYAWMPPSAGTYYIRASWPGDHDHDRDTSTTISVTFEDYTWLITLAVCVIVVVSVGYLMKKRKKTKNEEEKVTSRWQIKRE